MSEPFSIQAAFAHAHERFSILLDDEAFWDERGAWLAGKERQESEERAAAADALQARRFNEIPEVYRTEFNPSLSTMSKDTIRHCREWDHRSKRGIGLLGATGMGKTRLLCAVLRRLQCSWLYLPASKLSLAVSDQWQEGSVGSRAFSTLREAKRVRVLLLDDLGDEKHTEAITAELKDLVEHRTSRGLPILWTSNLSPEQITAKHGERGAAIVRRLAEFTWTP